MRLKARTAVDAHIQKLLQGSGTEVKRSPGRGRGLFALRTLEGDLPMVLGDAPIGRIVQAAGRAGGMSCSLCGHALGSPERQLRLLLRRATAGVAPGGAAPPGPGSAPPGSILSDPVSEVIRGRPLFTRTAPLFCSRQCCEEHERLFAPLRSKLVATRRFARHSRKAGCAFFLYAFKLICWALAEYRRSGDAAGAAAPLRALHGRPFWQALDLPPDPKAAAEFQKRLRRDTEESRLLALDALEVALLPCLRRAGWNFLEPAGYAHFLGALCCNSIGVVYSFPLVLHLLQVDGMRSCAARSEAVARLAPWVRALQSAKGGGAGRGGGDVAKEAASLSDSDGQEAPQDDEKVFEWEDGKLVFSTSLFPSFSGYAVFPKVSLLNHSCAPNCAVEFTFAADCLLLAQGRIEPGAELTISYLDASLGSRAGASLKACQQRRQRLQSYGFTCSCPCCTAAAAPPPPASAPQAAAAAPRRRRRRRRAAPSRGEEEPAGAGSGAGAYPADRVTGQGPRRGRKRSSDGAPASALRQEDDGTPCLACDGTGRLGPEACPLCGSPIA